MENTTELWAPMVVENLQLPSYFRTIYDLLQFCIAVAGISLCCFTIFRITKAQKLQIRLNALICHSCLISIILYLANANLFQIFKLQYPPWVGCNFFNFLPVFLDASALIMFMVSLDCVFEKLSSERFKILLICVWIFVTIYVAFNTVCCITDRLCYNEDGFVFFFVSALLLVRFVVHLRDVWRKTTNDDANFRQTICAVYVLSLAITIISAVIANQLRGSHWEMMFRLTYQAHSCYPIITTYLFARRTFDINCKKCICTC